MQALFKGACAALGLLIATHASAQITLYKHEGFQGRSFTTQQAVEDFERHGFNDRASSVVVHGEGWEVCDDARFGGRCTVLRQGRYPSLASLDLNDRVSSVRAAGRDGRVDEGRYESAPSSTRAARITFFEKEGFRGRSFTTEGQVGNFERFGFNDRASSAIVEGDRWEVCDDVRFRGRCVVLDEGRYRNLAAMRLNDRVSSTREVAPDRRGRVDRSAPVRPSPPVAQGRITLFEREGFAGRSFSTDHAVDNVVGQGFARRAYSAIVEGDAAGWEVCHATRYTGGCAVLRPGRYPDLAVVGVNDRIESVRAVRPDRRVGDERYEAQPFAAYDSRRRPNERLYEAEVTSVRAVMQTPEQRCWVEPGQVAEERGGANVPGAVLGAVIGGILGHQVGSGRGKDLATAGGAVAGAAVGANVGRDGGSQQGAAAQNVQRCSTAPASARPDYWDVTYYFRGTEHRTQMTAAPGRTVTVNEQGEPRS
ncbi:MAG: beta/gamma crystallin-related protein [Burkholderiaceae bacterium]